MRAFEYRVITLPRHAEDQLNGLGENGWELVSVIPKQKIDEGCLYYLKRERR